MDARLLSGVPDAEPVGCRWSLSPFLPAARGWQLAALSVLIHADLCGFDRDPYDGALDDLESVEGVGCDLGGER